MRAILPADIAVELENAIAAGPRERSARMLWRVTELFAAGRDRFDDSLIGVFDDILMRLIACIEPAALVRLSTLLADLAAVPQRTLRHLSMHDDPAVALPLLRKSQALSCSDLATIASSCGEQHLLAISSRHKVARSVTEILVKRGNRNVCLAVIRNPGAEFSDAAYSTLIGKAEQDDEITKALALRPGTPDAIVRRLLGAPSQKIAPKPEVAKPETVVSVLRASAEASAGSAPHAVPRLPQSGDYEGARPEIVALNRVGKLNDSAVNRFAIRGESANLFTALSVLSGAPIDVVERVWADPDHEGLVMACRASRLNWQTTLTILSNRDAPRLSFAERERAQQLFETLQLSTSQYAVRWGELAAGAGQTRADGRIAKSGAHR